MRKLNKNILHYAFIMFIYSLIPFAYLFNGYLYLSLIVIQGFVLLKKASSFGNKVCLLLLHTVLFSGTSFVGLHLYDWVILIAFVYFLLNKKGKMKISKRVVFFGVVVVLQALTHFTGMSVLLESIRYIICLILLIITINESFDFNEVSGELICISLANAYFAIMIYNFMNLNLYHHINNGIINAESYVFASDVRMNGFFSDPNKYMVFCFALLFLVEAYVNTGKKRNFLILSILFSAVISFSRTAIIVAAAYVVLKILIIIKESSKRWFWILFVALILITMLFLMVPGLMNRIMNILYVLSAQLLGREQALDLSSTLAGDNRPRIWRMAIELIEDNPLLGYGWLSNEYLLPYPTHNTILALLLDGGIITLFAYVYLYWPLLKCKRWDLIISCIMISSMMLDLQNYRIWFLILGLIMNKKMICNDAKHSFLKANKLIPRE